MLKGSCITPTSYEVVAQCIDRIKGAAEVPQGVLDAGAAQPPLRDRRERDERRDRAEAPEDQHRPLRAAAPRAEDLARRKGLDAPLALPAALPREDKGHVDAQQPQEDDADESR